MAFKDWKQKAKNLWEHEKKEIAIKLGEIEELGMFYIVILEQKYEEWQVKHHKTFQTERQAQLSAKQFMAQN